MICPKSVSALFLSFSIQMAMVLCCASCTTEGYETGDGKLSYLRADFVEVHTKAQKTLDYALTDDGDSLVFEPLVNAEWATTPDSIYRAMLMYNHKGGGKVSDVISVGQVMTLWMTPTSRVKKVCTDPVKVESMWMSRNGKYLNLGIYVKTGQADGADVRQSVAMLCDTVMTQDNGSKEYRLRLYHDQNGVPEYYSSRVYVSVPTASLRRGDVIKIEANTYDGVLAREFAI